MLSEDKNNRKLISSGSIFEEKVGYSRAVCDGRWVFVAGTTGFNYETMKISDDVVVQCRQTLENIGRVLDEAESDLPMLFESTTYFQIQKILKSAGRFFMNFLAAFDLHQPCTVQDSPIQE